MTTIVTMLILPEEITTIADFPQDFEADVLGTQDEVMTLVQSVFPQLTYSDVFMGNEDKVKSVGLRNPSKEVIMAFYERFGWRAVNPATGKVHPPFDPPEDDSDDYLSLTMP